MEPLFLSFLFLVTLTSAQSINNVAPSMQPTSSSSKPKADSPTSYSSYPPGYENENSPSQSESSSFEPSEFSSFEPSEFSSFSTDSISSSDQAGLSASLMSINPLKKICDNTDYPDLCTATIAPFMSGDAVNVEQILEMAMKASNQFAKLGFAATKRASESPGTPPKTKKMLKTCLDSWDTVLYNYEEAIEALRIHDSGRMNTMLSAAITDVSDCEDAFEGVVSPLIEYGEKMTKMTSNCLAIVSQLAS